MRITPTQRAELLSTIQTATNLSPEQKSALMGLLNERKRYGLVWEDKPEDAYEKLRTQLPVFTEIPERRIMGANPDSPDHILIEGDNLHALTALQYTHAGKVDVIYIDPPYNTGNKDFTYNDTYVDKEDTWRHSKWLSFMEKRLKLAKELLKETGVIFISIDDNEQAQLKMLCDEVFGEAEHISTNVWQKIHSIKNDARYLSVNHEFVHCYAKLIDQVSINLLGRTGTMDSRYKNPDNDSRGPWQSGDMVANEVRKDGNYDVISPVTGKVFNAPPGKHWVYSKENMSILLSEGRVFFGKDGNAFPRKKRFLSEVSEGRKATTWWDSDEFGHNQEGKRDLKEFFEQSEDLFATPKPIRLIQRVLELASTSDALILDFFAGSGTTLHATMALNAEDGGKRQCILVTNNENEICEKVTYERNKRVIQGYTNAKGQAVEGLINNTLRYYKTAFVPRESSLKNRREFARKATDLIAIKENAYKVRTDLNGDGFTVIDAKNAFVIVVVDPDAVPDVVDCIRDLSKPCKVYVFSPGNYAWDEDFAEVRSKVELIPIPEAYYAATENELPKLSLLAEAAQ